MYKEAKEMSPHTSFPFASLRNRVPEKSCAKLRGGAGVFIDITQPVSSIERRI
jgi:hypothetical protein